MSLPRYEISLLILLLLIMLVGIISHQAYLWRIRNNIRKTSLDRAFQEKDMKRALQIPQGSNFNTVMLFSWNLFLVSLIFLYFLTPEIFQNWNYFQIPKMASGGFGLAFMGAMILIPGFFLSLLIPQIYGYYLISRWLKELNLFTPILLIVSLFCSVNLATIYPMIDSSVWNAGYAALFASLLILILPIVVGFVEEMR
jgi:hypothetical protein